VERFRRENRSTGTQPCLRSVSLPRVPCRLLWIEPKPKLDSTFHVESTAATLYKLYIYIYIYIYICVCVCVCVCVWTGLDHPRSNPGGDEIFRPSRPALGPTQPPVKLVPSLPRG